MVNYKMVTNDYTWISGRGILLGEGKLEIGGMLPACNSQTIKNEIENSVKVILIGEVNYNITKVKIIDEDTIHLYYEKLL